MKMGFACKHIQGNECHFHIKRFMPDLDFKEEQYFNEKRNQSQIYIVNLSPCLKFIILYANIGMQDLPISNHAHVILLLVQYFRSLDLSNVFHINQWCYVMLSKV